MIAARSGWSNRFIIAFIASVFAVMGGVVVMLIGFGSLPNELGRANLTSSLAATGHLEQGTITTVTDSTVRGRWGATYHDYWPLVRVTLGGDTHDVSLQRFSSSHLEDFIKGQPIEILYDPARPTLAALGSPAARAQVTHNVHVNVVSGIIGVALVLAGLPIWIRVIRENAKAKRIHDADAAARGY